MNHYFFLALLMLANDASAANTSAIESPLCQLFIDGKGIEALEVRDKEDMRRGTTQRLKVTGPSLSLKPGHYQIREIYAGGFSPNAWRAITLAPEKPYHVRSGGSLRPHVEVKRQGRLLKMDYQLLDSSGTNCLGNTRDSARRPGFVIRQEGREIASGNFEYG